MYISKVELTGFATGLDVGLERQRGVKDVTIFLCETGRVPSYSELLQYFYRCLRLLTILHLVLLVITEFWKNSGTKT